jgi:hypothetical protein
LQSLKHAFRFTAASLRLVFSPPRVLKPGWVFLLGGLAILLMGWILIALITGLIGLTPLGLLLTGIMVALTLAGLLSWGEITMLSFCQAFFQRIQPAVQPPAAPLQQHWLDVLKLSLALPGILLIQFFKTIFAKETIPPWLEARHLLIPLISLEDRSLTNARKRLEAIITENLLRFRPSLVRVGLVASLGLALMTLLGLVIGFIAGVNIAEPLTAGPWRRILAAGAGIFIAGVISLAGIGFSAFLRSAYRTALYVWVSNVENARTSDETVQAGPPEILRNVLRKK